ncbi:type IV inositol polyphosphate 5-phosphatase 9-like isoform X2 [Phragmites australis]|uniref:type IV inositol polyphosphate 5-phosphatase 9-like isoform X2 n=1 Tax=Phragmites australis TaxID=29695 RepID=UPI002D78D694|nr:type IV inositol polyphosphate 5-phosphatase 9-like isoform X2 [Phragmites australis]
MIWPRSVTSKLPRHLFVSESTGLEKSTMQEGQNKTVKYKVFAGTWNVGGVEPPDDLDLEDWLDRKASSYDIYVLGFQEIVPLNARNVLGPKKRSASMKWDSLIGDALNSRRRRQGEGEKALSGCRQGAAALYQEQEAFRCVMSKQMVGIFVSVWARSGIRRHVRHPGACCIGAGVLGRLGNKGAVSVRFLLHGTSFCFVCCHLACGSGEGDALHRNTDAVGILSRTSFRSHGGAPAPEELPKKILVHDRVVFLGDLNYRIAMDDAEARQLVKAKKWSTLLENDELLLELSRGRHFDGWDEGLVTFPPTYKYQPNSDQFYWCTDGTTAGPERKHRTPAWCDRILWRGKGMRQIQYESCGSYRLSDHRPVRAVFHAVCEDAEGVDYLATGFCALK